MDNDATPGTPGREKFRRLSGELKKQAFHARLYSLRAGWTVGEMAVNIWIENIENILLFERHRLETEEGAMPRRINMEYLYELLDGETYPAWLQGRQRTMSEL